MSNDVLGVSLCDARGPIGTTLELLSGPDGHVWLARLNKFNRGQNPFSITVDAAKLEFVSGGAATIQAIRIRTSEPFATKTEDPGSPFGYPNLTVALASFRRSRKLSTQAYRLRKRMTFAQMIEAAGGEDVVRKYHLHTPDQIRALVDKQKNGDPGVLLNNGYANFAFTLAEDGKSLAVVYVYWDSDYRFWYVWSFPASRSRGWDGGYQLLLRAV